MKTLTVEKLLQWAYRQELPKAIEFVGGMAAIAAGRRMDEMAELGTLIDRSPNAWGVVPVYDEGEPHPDATSKMVFPL